MTKHQTAGKNFSKGRALILLCGLLFFFSSAPAQAYTREYEKMSFSVKTALRRSLLSENLIAREQVDPRWLSTMSLRLQNMFPQNRFIQNQNFREDLLLKIFHEAHRAGLDPQLVLAIIHVESAFNKYAISTSYARGLMQIMPFWTKEIGDNDPSKLFSVKTNLRYGTVILKHYLDIENGNLTNALGRYNGSYGRSKYPRLVMHKLQRYWQWS